MQKKSLWTVLLIIFLFTTLVGCGQKVQPEEQKEEKMIAVEIGNPQIGTLTENTTFSGQLKPINTVTVIPQVAGMAEIKDLRVQLGDTVKKDEVLFVLDSESISDQAENARLSYETAKKNYDKAKESIDNAKVNLARMEKLYKEGVISQQQYEQTQLSASDTQLKVMEAQLEQSRVAYENVAKQLSDATVKAPIGGIISAINVQEKGMATAQPALTITDISSLEVEIDITEAMINKVQKGQEVSLVIPSVSDESIKGMIEIINPVPDPMTQLYKVKIKVENGEDLLKPGMFAQVRFGSVIKDKVVTVPSDSVIFEEKKSFCFVVEGERAVRKEITIGADNGEVIEVVSGLKVEDQLIVKGQDFVKDGSKVKIVRGEM